MPMGQGRLVAIVRATIRPAIYQVTLTVISICSDLIFRHDTSAASLTCIMPLIIKVLLYLIPFK